MNIEKHTALWFAISSLLSVTVPIADWVAKFPTIFSSGHITSSEGNALDSATRHLTLRLAISNGFEVSYTKKKCAVCYIVTLVVSTRTLLGWTQNCMHSRPEENTKAMTSKLGTPRTFQTHDRMSNYASKCIHKNLPSPFSNACRAMTS